MGSKAKATTPTLPMTSGGLPKGWRMVRFDELAHMVNERVDPSTTDAEIYVGLEHLDPDSLKLRRWGTPSDVTGDKLQFHIGDVIFGRRRAYQRKLAVAEFDGICSAHAMVVRAKTETVDPKFLPFLMQSDLFMRRAIDISVGSLSPTINWTTLSIQEFPLPPKNEQRCIADILWAANDVVLTWQDAERELLRFRESLLLKSYPHGIDGSENELRGPWRTCLLSDIVDVKSGGTPSRQILDYWNGSIPWVKTGEVNYADILETEECITQLGVENSSAKLIPAGTILLALFGQGPTLGRVGRLLIEATVNQACAALLPSEKVDQDYLYFYLIREYESIRRLARGASQPNLNLSIVRNMKLPICDLRIQKSIGVRLRHVEQVKGLLSAHGHVAKNFLSEMMNSLITGRINVQ